MTSLALLLVLAAPFQAASFRDQVEARAFVKGQLHAHTLRSDGDAPPEEAAAWYAAHGYGFLALTDHNGLTLLPSAPLPLVPGVEITAHGARKPVHVNALCGRSALKGGHFAAGAQALADAIRQAHADGALALVNHPFWADGLTAADLEAAPPFELLELASGHPGVDDSGVEAVWQRLLDAGRPVFAAAVDDAHDYRREGEGRKPGRAWIEAWDAGTDAASACAALRAGRFYATTGARLSTLSIAADRFTIAADPLPAGGVIEFLGEGGRVLARSAASPASYRLTGSERFVRARVTLPDGRKAWTQAYLAAP